MTSRRQPREPRAGQECGPSAFDSADHGQGPEKNDENAPQHRRLLGGVHFGTDAANVAIAKQTKDEVEGEGDFEVVERHEFVTALRTAEPPTKGFKIKAGPQEQEPLRSGTAGPQESCLINSETPVILIVRRVRELGSASEDSFGVGKGQRSNGPECCASVLARSAGYGRILG